MTIPFLCIIFAFSLIYLSKLPVGVAQARRPEGLDNRHPRDQQAQLVGWGRRALAAHNNSIEGFPGFAAGVLMSHVGGADPHWAAILAIGYVAARIAYLGAYIADIHALRSSVWSIGLACTVGLMILPALR